MEVETLIVEIRLQNISDFRIYELLLRLVNYKQKNSFVKNIFKFLTWMKVSKFEVPSSTHIKSMCPYVTPQNTARHDSK